MLEAQGNQPDTINAILYKKLKPYRKRIVKRYLKKYYQKITWAYDQRYKMDAWTQGIDQTLKLPEICSITYGIMKSASHYFDLPKIPTPGDILALQALYNAEKRHLGNYIFEIYRGYTPKLTRTQMLREVMARGFVHKEDVIAKFDQSKYAIVVHQLPITWPFQFDTQIAGINFLDGFGIPGYMGCPGDEQGQKTFYKIR